MFSTLRWTQVKKERNVKWLPKVVPLKNLQSRNQVKYMYVVVCSCHVVTKKQTELVWLS